MERSDPREPSLVPRRGRQRWQSSSLSDDDEKQIIERIKKREEAALGELYDRHSPIVYGFLLRLLGHETAAHDALQQVFFEFWSNPGGSERLSSLATLVRIARRVAAERGSSPGERLGADIEFQIPKSGPLSALSGEELGLLTKVYFDNRRLDEIAESNVDELRARVVAAMQSLRSAIDTGRR